MSEIILGQDVKEYILEQFEEFLKNQRGKTLDKYDMINVLMKVAHIAAHMERKHTVEKLDDIADKELGEKYFYGNGDYAVGARDLWHSVMVEWKKL